MRDDELRDVLVVRAIEEADRDGAILPPADRAAAAREARRAEPESTATASVASDGRLAAPAERMLVTRARHLLARIVSRHGFVAETLPLAEGPAAAGWILILLGALAGFGLSALDEARRINILWPVGVLVLVGWNLVVYMLLALERARPGSVPQLPKGFLKVAFGRLSKRIAGSATFHAPLAEGLARFAREWFEAAHPLLVLRATRVFHLSALAAGLGLIAGIYLRGIAFDYQAGWESTFLDASAVRRILSIGYFPAFLVTGIPIPDVAGIEAIRWKGNAGGTRAASWLHLLAATVFLFVVLPRAALALAAATRIARRARDMPVPRALTGDFRNAFGAIGGSIGGGVVEALAYAYEPAQAARAGLRTMLTRVFGNGVTLDLRSGVRYGEEEGFLHALDDASRPDAAVLLFNLAATPEVENHGTMLAGLRDRIASAEGRARLLVLVDESAYAARIADAARLAERREAWREFVAAHGPAACFVDLAAKPSNEDAARIRGALWPSDTP